MECMGYMYDGVSVCACVCVHVCVFMCVGPGGGVCEDMC